MSPSERAELERLQRLEALVKRREEACVEGMKIGGSFGAGASLVVGIPAGLISGGVAAAVAMGAGAGLGALAGCKLAELMVGEDAPTQAVPDVRPVPYPYQRR